MRKRIGLGALALMLLSGCGSELTSITVSPAVVNAKNSPNGKVQFSAAGTYGGSSKPVPLSSVVWCVGNAAGDCFGFIDAGAMVDEHGVAICTGTHPVTILAGQGLSTAGKPDQGYKLNIFGTATLVCP